MSVLAWLGVGFVIGSVGTLAVLEVRRYRARMRQYRRGGWNILN